MESNGLMERDPNGVAAAFVVLITAVAAVFGATVDSTVADAIAVAVAAVLNLGAVFAARRKAWAPDTVRALTPATVGAAGELPAVPPR